jgi:4-amino-4-deoxy-L-arabinose transferase-like glycosyltransferase
MESLSWIDFFLRLIPEGLIIILAGYAISQKDINIKLYLISSFIIAFLSFIYSQLPVSTTLPMVLTAISTVIILSSINKIKTRKAILSTLICFVLLIITEGINMVLLNKIFNLDTNKIFLSSNTLMRNIYGLPSLLIYGLIVLSCYLILKKRKEKKYGYFKKIS